MQNLAITSYRKGKMIITRTHKLIIVYSINIIIMLLASPMKMKEYVSNTIVTNT